MLQLKPSCEHCAKALPPDSTEAMICSYECTFCTACVEDVLKGVCPNCGGNFVPRPIRPKQEWCPGVSLRHHPASTEHMNKPVEPSQHADLLNRLDGRPAVLR